MIFLEQQMVHDEYRAACASSRFYGCARKQRSLPRYFEHAALVLLLIVGNVQAQAPVALPRLSGPIQLDGLSSEPAWEAIAPLPLTMHEPTFQGTATEDTEIRIAYDDAFLYAAGRFYDAVSSGIRANSLYRDRIIGDDLFSLALDTFHDKENAVRFVVNPAGTRLDETIANDAQSGPGAAMFSTTFNVDWNTFWDAATTRTREGWFAELRIPLSHLRFQENNGTVIMALTVFRHIARKNETVSFPAVSPAWESALMKPSLMQPIVLRQLDTRQPFHATPYLAGGMDQQAIPSPTGAPFEHARQWTADVGGDLKYALNNDLTLDLTLNPDFAQAEADDQLVNLSRFPLIFPEKRPFFQERASIFHFDVGRNVRLFHSRRIGLHDNEVIPLIGGARLVGRVGSWDLGLINMQTARTENLPSENFGVLRFRRQVFNAHSYTGGLLTTHIGENGSINVASGLDGLFRVINDEYLTLQGAYTHEQGPERLSTHRAGGLVRADWERRRQQGLNYSATFTWTGADFNPGLGIMRRRNYTQLRTQWGYGWFPGEGSVVRSITPDLFLADLFFRNEDRNLDLAFLMHAWTVTLKSGVRLNGGVRALIEHLNEPFGISEEITISAGDYAYYRFNAGYTAPAGRLMRTSVTGAVGTFYDGWSVQLTLEPTWNVARGLELGGTYEMSAIRFPDRSQALDVHVARLRIRAAFNAQASVFAFLQYSSTADLLGVNLRFRYHFREGNDLWIVFNEGLNTARHADQPVRPLSDSRVLLLKYTYTFHL